MTSCPLQLLKSVKVNHQVIQAIFIVVEVEKQLPWLGRYWMALLQFDVVTLMEQVTQVYHTLTDSILGLLYYLCYWKLSNKKF